MDKTVSDFIAEITSSCLSAPYFASLPQAQKDQIKEKLENYFYGLMVETLIDNLNDDQLKEIKDLDFNSPEMQEKIAHFSASIPGFILTLDEKLKAEAQKISQTGQIPQ